MSTISLLALSMEGVADSLDDPVNVDELLYLICLAAVDAVRGAEYAGITLADRHGRLETAVATHPVVNQLDALQYEFNEGPGVDAVRGRWQARSDDLRFDLRWPRYRPQAVGLGIRAQIGIELFDEPGMIAGLNLYSRDAGVFDDDTFEAAMLFAVHAAHTLGRAMARKDLTAAMNARTVIGKAIGMVMNRYRLSEDRAFEFLTRLARVNDSTIQLVSVELLREANRTAETDAVPAKQMATITAIRV
jgi:hypothetical protein